MEVGSIWGHGSYVAPDWSADWLHRECVFILNEWARAISTDYEKITPENQAQLRSGSNSSSAQHVRSRADDTVDPVRAKAFAANCRHYSDVFSNGNTDYAIPRGAVRSRARHALSAFFFWTSWAASTNRPGDPFLYEQLAA